MRFAFVSTMDGSPWGGSEELWGQTASRLKQEGHEVWASVECWPRLADQVTRLAEQGIDIQTHSSRRPQPRRRVWNRFTDYNGDSFARLKKFNPSLVVISQGHNEGGFQWAKACREHGLPYVMIVQCNSELWWFRSRLEDAVASYTAARRVYCVSRRNLDQLRLQLGEPLQNAEVVWNPCKVSPDCPSVWPDPGTRMRLACVARLDIAAKGQDLLLQVLARPEWHTRPIELNFFGAGADETILRRMASMLHLDHVYFRGHVADVRAIWEQNHLLILPSRYEGLPLVLIEAMRCARPSVVTDIGGNAELCVDNETGFVAPAPTVNFVNEALQRAWQRVEDWRGIGQSARTRVEELVPKDPVGVFCDHLMSCVSA